MLSPPFSPANNFAQDACRARVNRDFADRSRRDPQDRDNLSAILPFGHILAGSWIECSHIFHYEPCFVAPVLLQGEVGSI